MDPMGNHFTHLVESCRIYTPCNREKILHDISTWLTSSMCVFLVLPWKKYKDQNHQTCLIIDIHMFRWNPQEFLPSSPSSRFVTGGGFFEARQRRRWTFGLFFLLLLVLFGLFCHLSEKHETTRRRVVRETIWGAVKIYYNCLVCFWRVIVFWGGSYRFTGFCCFRHHPSRS